MIRVLLADDQALLRAGFRMLREAAEDIEVVAEAASTASPPPGHLTWRIRVGPAVRPREDAYSAGSTSAEYGRRASASPRTTRRTGRIARLGP